LYSAVQGDFFPEFENRSFLLLGQLALRAGGRMLEN